MPTDATITVGLLGCGVVGGGVAQRLLPTANINGRRVELGIVLVRNLAKPRTPPDVKTRLTARADAVLDDPRPDVIVECLGGIEPAATYVETALRLGIPVVTANKALIADRGAYLEALAVEFRTSLRYEAAVGGAVPIVRTLARLSATDEIVEVGGVLNGTTNFVLSAMEGGASLDDAVRDAQQKGFAEADPTTDIDGFDAAHKLTILAAAAFKVWPKWESIARRGIREITQQDIAYARARNCRVKFTARARRTGANTIVAAVGPTFVPRDHPFASPNGAENVALIVAKHAGPIILGGLGAGREPTASSIIADLYDVIAHLCTPPKEISYA